MIVPSLTTTGCPPTDASGTVSSVEHTLPLKSIDIGLVFQDTPPNVIPPTGIVPFGIMLVTHMVTFVPIGPEVGVIVITGAVIEKVVVPTVPPDVVTSTGFAPQQTAVRGTLMLTDHRPEPSMGITVVFQGTPSNFMPPTGIVSSGTKLEPVRVVRV
jgi:hypothetical protein